MKNQNSSNILYTVAGLYLLYLAWSLVKGLRQGDMSGTTFIVSILGSAVFAVAGALLLFKSFRSMFTPPAELPEETGETAEIAEETEVTGETEVPEESAETGEAEAPDEVSG